MKTHPSAQTLGFSKVKKAALLLFSVAELMAGGTAAGNEAPVISTHGASISYEPGSGAKLIVTNASVSDTDSGNFSGGSLTVTITSNYVNLQDVLGITDVGGITISGAGGSTVKYLNVNIGVFSFDDFVGELTVVFTASATPVAARALMEAITYYNGNPSPSMAIRTVRFTLNDGDGSNSDPDFATITLPLPLLNIQLVGNTNIVLSWATNFPGFTLEANTNLTSNAWSVVSPAPSVSGTNNVVTNAVSGSTRFYRLRK